VAAVPGPVTAPRSAGTNALLRDGAILVRGVDDVLDALYGVGARPPARRAGEGLEPELAALLAAAADGCDTVAALVAATGEPAAAVRAGLAELELRGLVRREPGGRHAVVL
jgi:DNA processing protein